MAPEQPQGGPLGPWTDLYSVGCLAHALRMGTAPFGETGSPVAILLRQVNDVAPRVKGPLADWIEWLTAKDPADRPQSPQEARVALTEMLTTRMGRKWRCEVVNTAPLTFAIDVFERPLEPEGGRIRMPDTPRERGTLRPYLGHLSLAQAGGVLESVLAALADAHANAVVHGQLSPDHLVVTPDGRVEVTGSGLPVAPLELPYTTTAYMAPEYAQERDIGPWADLYSAGCVAHALFTGQPPHGDSDVAIVHLLKHVLDPVARVPDVDPRIADWIECLLAKEPTERPRSAGEAWNELEAILIALLGPSWRHEAALPPEPPEPPPTGLVCIDVFEPPTGDQSWDALPEPLALSRPAPALPAAEVEPTRSRPGRTLAAAIAGGVAAIAIAAGAIAADGPSPTPAPVVHVAPIAPELASRDDLGTGARATAATLRSAGITRVLEWLGRRERALAPALDGPRRVGATKRLWWAYVGAAKRLRQVEVAPADRELRGRLAEAVRLAGCAYGRAAGHPERVQRENQVVRTERQNAAAALRDLAAAGYTLPPAAATFPQIS